MSGGMSDEEIAKFWANFIAEKQPYFRLPPIEQLPSYVIPVREAVVDAAIIADDGLNAHLQWIKPDLVAVDNVILFPGIYNFVRRHPELGPDHDKGTCRVHGTVRNMIR